MESLQQSARLFALVKRIRAAQAHEAPPPHPPRHVGVPGFEPLARNVAIWRPPATHKRRSRSLIQSPPLIVFCSGRAATPAHIAKYTEKYKYLYPEAAILLLQCPAVPQDLDLDTAAELVRRHVEPAPATPPRGIVIHVASAGGAHTATRLARALARANARVPLEAMVLDSAPGRRGSAPPWVGASSRRRRRRSPPTAPRMLASRAVDAVRAVAVLARAACPCPDTATRAERDLNDPALFPTAPGRRLYLYSTADACVAPERIGAHAGQAAAVGYAVTTEVFATAQHCSLTMEDGRRYWTAIQKVVEGEEEEEEEEEGGGEEDKEVNVGGGEERGGDERVLIDEEAGIRTYLVDRGLRGSGSESERGSECGSVGLLGAADAPSVHAHPRRTESASGSGRKSSDRRVTYQEPGGAGGFETNADGEPSWLDV